MRSFILVAWILGFWPLPLKQHIKLALRFLTRVGISVKCLFKGRPIRSFSVVITSSTFLVFIFKRT